MTHECIEFNEQIEFSSQGTYFTRPFTVPAGIGSLTLRYTYSRRSEKAIPVKGGEFVSQPEENIIDLGLIRPDGTQAGASGSDKTEITISENYATPGYQPGPIIPGEWQILIGAYKVAREGVSVNYKIHMGMKHIRLLKGDLHVHTLASDGVHSAEELAMKASRNGLDFLSITDHNQMVSMAEMPRVKGVTMIPGVEWTHYQGHANFLGVDKPYDEPFSTNSFLEIQSRFASSRARGALITINHPFEDIARFQLDYMKLPFDCIEVWNGPMRESNLRAVGLWQQLLTKGMKIPLSAGSDYHRDTPFIFLGGPTMCVFSMSAGASDILDAIRKGHAYATFAPNGPTLVMTSGQGLMGDTVLWKDKQEMTIVVEGLLAGDVLQIVTGTSCDVLYQAPTDGKITINYKMAAPGFARVEILRSFLPGLPMLPALLSNPIYFD